MGIACRLALDRQAKRQSANPVRLVQDIVGQGIEASLVDQVQADIGFWAANGFVLPRGNVSVHVFEMTGRMNSEAQG